MSHKDTCSRRICRFCLGLLILSVACAPHDATSPPSKDGSVSSPESNGANDAGDGAEGHEAPPATTPEAGTAWRAGDAIATIDSGLPSPLDPPVPDAATEPGVDEPVLTECVFSSPDVSAPSSADAPPPISVGLDDSPFLGDYLVNQAGKPLYFHGGDTPGDCNTEPKSNCVANCAAAWPPYHAAPRVLAEGLDPSLFGTITREDGSQQTTYLGWPLYAFRSDAKPETPAGAILGEGKRRLWFTARRRGYNLFVMLGEDDVRYLVTGGGRTLYAFGDDTAGNSEADPVSACRGQCRAEHPPVRLQRLNPASALLPEDFAVFARGEGGGVQLSYRGQPLYYSVQDEAPGETNGLSENWTLVEP